MSRGIAGVCCIRLGDEVTQHSALGASSCKRWWHCPGSVSLSAGLPNESSDAAREGTAAHALAEQCLTYYQDAAELIDRTLVYDDHGEPADPALLRSATTGEGWPGGLRGRGTP